MTSKCVILLESTESDENCCIVSCPLFVTATRMCVVSQSLYLCCDGVAAARVPSLINVFLEYSGHVLYQVVGSVPKFLHVGLMACCSCNGVFEQPLDYSLVCPLETFDLVGPMVGPTAAVRESGTRDRHNLRA